VSTPAPPAGRVALVTGTDNPRGIGRACVGALTAAGFEVACSVMPHGEGPQEAALVVPADLADPGAPVALLDAVAGALGPVTALVNNAAVSERDGFERLDAATLDRHHAVNVRATALLSCLVARRLADDHAGRRAGISGRIVSLTSGQFLGPMPGELAYTATKGAIEAFTRQLGAEIAHLGITVNAVGPGPTDTGWIDDALRAELIERFPTGRIGEPADAARLVAWLCSPDAAWVTGQVIHSEGGFRRV
jgi:3-oxoacyl-[acyl-carrier protein] reductase